MGWRGRRVTGRGAAGCRLEPCAIRTRKHQSFRQLPYGVPVRAPPLAALEQADGLRGEARPFGQVLLGNVGRVAVAPKQVPECASRAGVHFFFFCFLPLDRSHSLTAS